VTCDAIFQLQRHIGTAPTTVIVFVFRMPVGMDRSYSLVIMVVMLKPLLAGTIHRGFQSHVPI